MEPRREEKDEKKKVLFVRIISGILAAVLVISLILGVAFCRDPGESPGGSSSSSPVSSASGTGEGAGGSEIRPVNPPDQKDPDPQKEAVEEKETEKKDVEGGRPGTEKEKETTAPKEPVSPEIKPADPPSNPKDPAPQKEPEKEPATEEPAAPEQKEPGKEPEQEPEKEPEKDPGQTDPPAEDPSAGDPEQPTEPTEPTEPEKEPDPPTPPVQDPAKDSKGNLILAEKGKKSLFRLVADDSIHAGTDPWMNIAQIPESLAYYQKATLDFGNGTAGNTNLIFFGECAEDPYTTTLFQSLKPGQYTVRVVSDAKGNRVYLGYNGSFARMGLVDWFLENVVNGKDTVTLPPGFTHTGTCALKDAYIRLGITDKLRDPYLLYAEGTYYCYGTGWVYYKNTSGKLTGKWEGPFNCVTRPADAETNFWAPEVYALDGNYYMFTTYKSKSTGHRGVAIFKSAKPEGPFTLYSDGQITPSGWDAIDGSLYVDKAGQPWLVYVHEWTSMSDGVGRMVIQKMSRDLKKLEGSPVTLFSARSAPWSNGIITDGCTIVTQKDGTLTMIWSNWDSGGYCVGLVKNNSGRVDDPAAWKQLSRRIYSKNYGTGYDGGHGMIFQDKDGQIYLLIHSPNTAAGSVKESPALIPIREDCGTLVWDLP